MRKWLLVLMMIGFAACGVWGLTWGLYSPERGRHLFPTVSDWSPQRVAEVRGQVPPVTAGSAADVDPNPRPAGPNPVVLNESEEDIAEIYARYLLYSAQPDEMITFRALGQMNPSQWDFDPHLYQYGGVFIYPVAALVKLADLVGWAPIMSETEYLTHPEVFARYYWLGRLYVVFWGILGMWVVYALAARLAEQRSAGLLAAVLFALLPVVVALSHEMKPHLPGAVLMLFATLMALKYVEFGEVRHRLLLAVGCGLAAGTVLSGVWIFVLIPLAECLTRSTWGERAGRSVVFILIGLAVFALANPYVVIHLFGDRTVLARNLENSTSMYHLGNFADGLANVWRLLIESSSIFVVIAGIAMLVALWGWDWRRTMVMAVPAALIFIKLAAFGENKPPEYARFAVFPSAILCVLAAAGVHRFLAPRWYQATLFGLALASAVAWPALDYFENLHRAASGDDVRLQLATVLTTGGSLSGDKALGLLREPAPYNCPPLDFANQKIVQLPFHVEDWPKQRAGWPDRIIVPLRGVEGVDVQQILDDGYYRLPEGQALPEDDSPVSWANKPLVLLVHPTGEGLAAGLVTE